MTTAPETLLLGGRYAVGPLLGRGGMADVHQATDTVLGRDVAVKLFRPHVEDADRTSSEIALLASLNHHGLVSLFDAGTTDGGAPFLVMELVDGPTLSACCHDGTLSPERVATIGADLADALGHCHAKGVVHRDIKPANVLLTIDDRAKLTDFGIARLVDAARHTATGMTVGTAPYFSPEQVKGAAVGPPSDVYSLGLLLLECLTGVREYAETNPVACAVARLHRAPTVPASLPAPWPDLLTRMTAEDPSARPTATEVAALLRGTAVPTQTVATQEEDRTTVLERPVPLGAAAGGPGLVEASSSPAPDADRHLVPGARPGLPPWALAVKRHLADDPAGQIIAAVLLIVLLLVVAVAAFAATGGGSSGGGGSTPIERLQDSVEP